MFLNPYIAGNPIRGSGFFGREDIVRAVLQMLRHPQENAIVLYGQRRIGKTSVLLHLEQRLAATGDYTPIYFDLQDKADKSLGVVLHELAQRISLAVGHKLPQPEPFDDEGNYFRDAFLPTAAQAAAKGGLVLLFDEFDVLDSPQPGQAGEKFFPYLRDWMTRAEGVNFVFVIGRRPEDLSTNSFATFKGARANQVGLLPVNDAMDVISQSIEAGSLLWVKDAMARVWEWTQGHPYFTQLLCSVVWEQMHDGHDQETVPQVLAHHVDPALDATLKQGANAFFWIWDGLPPAERVIMAAMAESEKAVIAHDDLITILNQSGVRLIVRQLELAPDTLVQWGLLTPTDGGHRFTVPLLKHWVARNKPLRRVKEELDQLDPLAERLFQTGQSFYQLKRADDAIRQLQEAIRINPNHLKAHLLLGQIYSEQNSLHVATITLKTAYDIDAEAAKSHYIKALLDYYETDTDTERQLKVYNDILKMDPGQPIARQRREVILTKQRIERFREKSQQAIQHQEREQWAQAIVVLEELLTEVPDEVDWQRRLAYAQQQQQLAQLYNQAIGALETGDKETAQRLLSQVIGQRPNYKQAARLLLRATEEIDVGALQTRIEHLQTNHRSTIAYEPTDAALQAQLERLQAKAEPARPARQTPAQQADEPPLDTPKPKTTVKRLSALNPLDYARLWWWLFMQRGCLQKHRSLYGGGAEERIGSWLSSTLTWLPFFILTLAGTMGRFSSIKFAFILFSAVCISWAMIGLLGDVDNFRTVNIVSVVVGSVAVGITVGVTLGVTAAIAVVVAVGVAVGVAGSLLCIHAGTVVSIVAIGVVLGVLVDVATVLTSSMTDVVAVITGVVIAGSLAGGTVLLVAREITENENILVIRVLGLLSWAIYLFLFWFAFLGGANILSSTGL
ncbi:MAG: AAA family ATPase [Anaerolineales bacterium]|nr:AAA family ATPase [Anaerolineales bacterium]